MSLSSNSGAGWETNRWKYGIVYALTGANAGTSRIVQSNNSTTLTTTSAFSNAIVAGVEFLVLMSSNSRWSWATLATERNDWFRGRWFVNSQEHTPSLVSYESPGSWRPELVWDNRDSFGIKRYSMIDVGDPDPFALFDGRRMWEGNDSRVYQPGAADGVSITLPYPVDEVHWDYYITNPNAMIKVAMLARASGAEEWATLDDDDVVAATSTQRTFSTTGIQANFGDVYQIAHAIGPVNDIEIDLDWRRDTGSATSGSTTTMTDSTKEWATDQFDNGKIRMLSGANQGKARSITSNTSTQITHSAFPTANADGDRYIVTNSRLQGAVRDDDWLVILFDDSVMVDSGLGTETEVYECSMTLWIGEGPNADPDGQHRVLIGYAAGERRVFLTQDEQIEIDAANRRIRIWDAVAEEYVQELTDPAVIVQYHDGTDWRRSADWLPLGIGNQSVWIEETNIGTVELSVIYQPSYLGG